MKNYNALLKEIMRAGIDREGRNGVTRGVFVRPLRFKMSDGFPAMTTKKLAFRNVAAELFWFMSGQSDNKILQRLGCEIWTGNANNPKWKEKAKFTGDLGRIYGVQWRTWRTTNGKEVDQLSNMVKTLRKEPHSRKNIVNAWNAGEIDQMALEPCHVLFQTHVANGKLSLVMFQRSCDLFLGVPFNIASYALLLHLLARFTNLKPDELIIVLSDVHIYDTHFKAVKEQIKRKPYKLPKLWINPKIKKLSDVDVSKLQKPEDVTNLVQLKNYKYHPPIKAPMSV